MFKAPTQPADPVAGVLDASCAPPRGVSGVSLAEYLARGDILVHGTTHAINAIVTGRTARTAFLTTAGHPDTLVFPGRRPAGRLQLHRPLSCAIRAQGADIRDSRANPERRFGVRASRRNRRGRSSSTGRGAGAWRRSPSVCCGPSSIRRTKSRVGALDRAPSSRRALHAVASHQPVHSRIPARDVDRARRVAETDDERLPERPRARMRDAGFAGRILVVTSQGGVMDARRRRGGALCI